MLSMQQSNLRPRVAVLLLWLLISSLSMKLVMGGGVWDSKPHSLLVEATKVFESNQSIAPKASLTFRLYPRYASINKEAIKLYLQTPTTKIPLSLSQELGFSLPESTVEAKLMLNQQPGDLIWRADIRSPGLAAGSRRLGDLRLECQINQVLGGQPVAEQQQNCQATPETKCMDIFLECLGATLKQVVASAVVSLEAPKSLYKEKPFSSVFIADRPLLGLTLVEGERKATLTSSYLYAGALLGHATSDPFSKPPDFLGYFYELPLNNTEWSNDSLVFFEYMDDL